MSELCKCCGQVIRKPRATKSKGERMLAEDLRKAQAAIAVLKQFDSNTQERPEFIQACSDESERMLRALSTPTLLWSIYHRNVKGMSSYTEVKAIQKATR